jgi:AraC-like DNA-binding protein
VPAFGKAIPHNSPQAEITSEKEAEKEATSMKHKRGKLHQRYQEIEARKNDILAIWGKSGHKVSTTAGEAGLSCSTLLGKFKQWGVKTPLQEMRARLAQHTEQLGGEMKVIVSWPPHIPKLLTVLLEIMPAPGSNNVRVDQWKLAWDAAFSLIYDSDTGDKP